MSRYQCPVCGEQQEFQNDKEYGFCRRCGTKLVLRPRTASDLAEREEEILLSDLHIEMDETNAVMSQLADHTLEFPENPAKSSKGIEEDLSQDPEESEEEWEEEEEQEEEQREEKISTLKSWILGTFIAALILGAVACAYLFWFKPASAYKLNMTRHSNGEYAQAIEGFLELGDYKDSLYQADLCRLDKALAELQSGRLAESAATLNSIADKTLDTSTYDAMAGARLQQLLVGDHNYEKALEALNLLPAGRVKDVENSFFEAFGRSLADKEYREAAQALGAFAPWISHPEKAEEMVAREAESLMDNGQYQDASALNQAFSSLLADPGEDVWSRFQTFLEEGEYYRAAALLAVFEEQVGERKDYEEELKNTLNRLLEEEKDAKALELCYAFESFTDMMPFLKTRTSELLKDSAKAGQWDRLNAVLAVYGPYFDNLDMECEELYAAALKKKSFQEAEDFLARAESPHFDKREWEYALALAYYEEEMLEQAHTHFRALEGYRDSRVRLEDIVYRRIIDLWDEGRDEEAEKLIQELESQEKGDQIRKEAKLRSVTRLMEKDVIESEEFTEAYKTLYGIRNHEGAPEKLTELLEKWADTIMQNVDKRPYLEAMSGMGFVSAKNREHVCNYVMNRAVPLGGRKQDGVAWTMKDQWLPYNIYRFLELISDDSGPTRAFIRYAMSMDKENVEIEITDIWNLWDLRADVREICSSNEYLLLFLSGVWTSEDGGAKLEVTKKNKVLTAVYDVSPTKAEGDIQASVFGLVSSKGRLCDIRIIDYHTIELTNVADGRTYRMTRP